MQIRHFLGIAAIGLLSTGCISQDKYNALRIERDGLNEQLARAQQDSSTARAQAASWKAQLDQIMSGNSGTAGLLGNQSQQIANLTAQLNDITQKYNDALGRIGQGQPLPAQLTNELTAFADQNPDLVEFDAAKGTVKFKSDLTFNSGDAQLKPEAVNAIERFSRILNSASAAGYELMVCGHADNQKVSAGTAQRGHKDNWYLSSHRALSVAEALQKQGVDSKRIGAVGYGEFRPIADNSTKQGMAANRRVEVLILPSQIGSENRGPVAAAPASDKPRVEVNQNNQALNK